MIKNAYFKFHSLREYFKEINNKFIKLNDFTFIYDNFIFSNITNNEIKNILKDYLKNYKQQYLNLNIYIISNYRIDKYAYLDGEDIYLKSFFDIISPIKSLQTNKIINGIYVQNQQYEIITQQQNKIINVFFTDIKLLDILSNYFSKHQQQLGCKKNHLRNHLRNLRNK